MKKKLLLTLVIFALLCSFCFLPASAVPQNSYATIMAYNDNAVTLSGMPAVWENSALYFPINFFTENCGIRYSYDGVSETLYLNNSLYSLSFNIRNNYCLNQDMRVFSSYVFFTNGTFYVPAALVARQFGMAYAYISEGPIVRIYTLSANLTNEELLQKLKYTPSTDTPTPLKAPLTTHSPESKLINTIYICCYAARKWTCCQN